MKYKEGFTFIELIVALAICSLMFVFLLPNMVRQYSVVSQMEKQLQMKEILYEEVSNHYDAKVFQVYRDNYVVTVDTTKAEIVDRNSGEKITYD